MNQTEKRLMKRALDDGQISIEFGYVTYRKNSRFGAREANAARKLEEYGFIKFVNVQHRCDSTSNNTSTIHTTTVKYELIKK